MPAGESIHTQIERQRTANLPEANLLKRFRDYAEGRQKGTLSHKQQLILRGVVGNRFCDNICKKALTEAANRLELVRFDVSSSMVADYLSELYTKTNLDDLSGEVHLSTLRDGNHAVSLSWDNESGRVILTREQWWDGQTGIYIHYDSRGETAYAVKDWFDDEKFKRRVIYWPDRIERYIANGEGWRRYSLPEDNGIWPQPWLATDGSPLGVPVIHFANGSTKDTRYGTSDLDGGILGLQDEINDLQRDLTTAGRMTAFQMVYATGVKDATSDLYVGPGAIFTNENDAARYGTIPAGDLSQMINQLEVKLQTAARNTSTPLHIITGGNWPSGEALIRAEYPLVAKVQKLAKTVGPAWASVAHMATKLANIFGLVGLDENSLIRAIFSPVERRDILTLAQVANLIAPYVSNREVLRVLSYTPERIDQIMLEREQESAAALLKAQQLAQINRSVTSANNNSGGNNGSNNNEPD